MPCSTMALRLALALCLLAATLAAPAASPGVLRLPLQKHHLGQRQPSVHHARKYAQMAESTGTSVPVGGDLWPVAIFWASLKIGTPGAEFPVAIDSGSSLLDVPQKGCKGCVLKPPNNVYDPSASSSSKLSTCTSQCPFGICKSGKCTFENTYETCAPKDPTEPCTISGDWFTDTVSWGGTKPVNVSFGAIGYQTSNFEQFFNIDGVVGMAGGSGTTNVFQQMVAGGAVDEYIWGLCLHQGKTSNGSLTLGGIDDRMFHGSVVYTPNTGSPYYYTMSLAGIDVGDTAISGLETEIIIDSGTNILLLPTEAYTSMRAAFEAICSTTKLTGICDVASGKSLFDKTCYNMTAAELAAFPSMTIRVKGIDLNMTPANYLITGYSSTDFNAYCLAVEPTGQGGLLILGDTTLENYYTVFDRKNKRIGWAPVNKDNCGSV